MSDRRAALAAFLLAGAAAAGPPGPRALLARAERVRSAFPEGVLTIRVTLSGAEGGKPAPAPMLLEVAVKAGKSRLRFLEPGDAGKFVVISGGDTWLLLPKSRNPIRIPASHRVRGGLSASEISRLSFVDDYDAVMEREDDLDGRRCAVLRLSARKGVAVSYPVVRVWVDEKEALYRKAIFLLASGRTAKVAAFDAYRTAGGILVLDRMTITDALRPGTTVVEYLEYDRRPVPDAWFDPKTARGN
jgi:hypothetical protein